MGWGHMWQNCLTSLNFEWGEKEEALLPHSWRTTKPQGTTENNPIPQDSGNQNPTNLQ